MHGRLHRYPQKTAQAEREALNVYKRSRDELALYPESVKATILGVLKMSEPDAAGIARAEAEIARRERRMPKHRQAAETAQLKALAHALQIIVCQFSPALRDDPDQLRHWLEEALLIAGIAPPGKNKRRAYFDDLMLEPKVIAAAFDE